MQQITCQWECHRPELVIGFTYRAWHIGLDVFHWGWGQSDSDVDWHRKRGPIYIAWNSLFVPA